MALSNYETNRLARKRRIIVLREDENNIQKITTEN